METYKINNEEIIMDKDHIPLTIVSIIAALLVVELAWSEIARHFGF